MKEKFSLSTLKLSVKRSKKRIGRGHGSGKVKTSGRGTKGQKARGTVRAGFEGGQLELNKRLPFLRGKGKNYSKTTRMHKRPLTVPFSRLGDIPEHARITIEYLHTKGIVNARVSEVKVVGPVKLIKAITLIIPCTHSVRKSIEKAGGQVITHTS